MERAGQNGWQVRTHANTCVPGKRPKHTHTLCIHILTPFILNSSNAIINLLMVLHAWPYSYLLFCVYAYVQYIHPVNSSMCVNPGQCYLCGEFQWGSIPPALRRPGPTSGEEICHRPGAWETTEHLGTGNIIYTAKQSLAAHDGNHNSAVSILIRHLNPPIVSLICQQLLSLLAYCW